jgi:hypothetical protein
MTENNAGENKDYINLDKYREPKSGVLFIDYVDKIVLKK